MDQCRDFYGSEEYENVARDIMNKQRGVGGEGGEGNIQARTKNAKRKKTVFKTMSIPCSSPASPSPQPQR